MLEQHALREMMSEDLLFAKISEPEMAVINFDDRFRDRMGKLDRGHIEVFPKLWSLRPSIRQTAKLEDFRV